MGRFLVSFVLLALVAPVAAEQPVDVSKEYEMREMGIVSDRDPIGYPDAPAADTYNGTLTASSPVWDRIFGSAIDPGCAASMSDSGNDGQYYEAIPIQVTAAEDLAAEVISFAGGDTVIAVYCDPFDPLNPMANVIAYDDDDGVGTLSAFTAADGVTLQPGNTYWLVFSTFAAGSVGDFTVDFTSATVVVVPVELQSFSVE